MPARARKSARCPCRTPRAPRCFALGLARVDRTDACAALLGAALVTHQVARARDRRAARQDPHGGGVIIGEVRRGGRLARPRPYVLPWAAFHEHVIVDGPTGAGKTFTFIEPILRAF